MKLDTLARGGALAIGVGLALAPIAVDAIRAAGEPGPDEPDRAAALIREGWQVGDCAVVRPPWFPMVLSRLQGLGEGTDAWPFPALMAAEELDPIALGACQRVWWMSWFGWDAGPAPLSAADVVSSTAYPEAGAAFELIRHVLRPLRVFRTLSADLPSARVFRGAPGSEGVRCRSSGGRHLCQRDPWLDVRLEARHVGHHEVEWPFLHPAAGGEVLRVVWPGVDAPRPPHDEAFLVVRAGFSMEAVRHPDGSPVTLEILVGGEARGSVVIEPLDWTLHQRVIPLGRGVAWPDIELRIAAAGDPGWRELLADAVIVDRVPEGLVTR
jgi:hypothetical protein